MTGVIKRLTDKLPATESMLAGSGLARSLYGYAVPARSRQMRQYRRSAFRSAG
jgi:hypothetical protein